jgi:hypothetical protein
MFFAFEQGKLFQGPCHPAKPDRTRKTQVQRGGTWAHRIGCGHARLDRQAPFHRRAYRRFADGDISRIAASCCEILRMLLQVPKAGLVRNIRQPGG